MDKIKLDRNLFEVMEKITKEGNKKENLEKILTAYIFGYEEESDKYNIILFKKNGLEYVLWEIAGDYDVDIKEKYDEDEMFKKSFTSKEIAEKFPLFRKFAQKNK